MYVSRGSKLTDRTLDCRDGAWGAEKDDVGALYRLSLFCDRLEGGLWELLGGVAVRIREVK
jgi:hypothetical protein